MRTYLRDSTLALAWLQMNRDWNWEGAELGLDELRQAAEKGQYLRPYAKLLLALACLREKQDDMARVLLSDLSMEFPNNPLFALELERLNIRAVSGRGGH